MQAGAVPGCGGGQQALGGCSGAGLMPPPSVQMSLEHPSSLPTLSEALFWLGEGGAGRAGVVVAAGLWCGRGGIAIGAAQLPPSASAARRPSGSPLLPAALAHPTAAGSRPAEQGQLRALAPAAPCLCDSISDSASPREGAERCLPGRSGSRRCCGVCPQAVPIFCRIKPGECVWGRRGQDRSWRRRGQERSWRLRLQSAAAGGGSGFPRKQPGAD